MQLPHQNMLAVWLLTPNGVLLANKIIQNLPDTCVYASRKVDIGGQIKPYQRFENLAEWIEREFHRYAGHVFIMSTGIVVRLIAPLIKHKTVDPAVVVVDDGGHHAISLLSGHLGGANDLTRRIATLIGARPVITTATDVNQVPAIDVLAKEKQLLIENPAAIKIVNMALLNGETIWIHDPHHFLAGSVPNGIPLNVCQMEQETRQCHQTSEIGKLPGIFVDDVKIDLAPHVLVLRPASLAAGIGCNRNTAAAEMKDLLTAALRKANLALASITCLASIDVKTDENGLIELGRDLDLPIVFYNRQELNQVERIQNPSSIVEKHVGVKSVCEAAAILAAQNGTLIVPKLTTRNVTVAIARISSLSSASGPAAPII